MISVSKKKWLEREVNKNLKDKIKQDHKYSEIISKIIISRNFDSTEISCISNILNIPNVFKNNSDFNDASDFLINSIIKKENICILGDYDVDGSASTSLLVRFFNHINHPHFYYIPDREKDGYGASSKLFQRLIKKKPKLIILVDCGSTSNDAINFLNKNNIKSIIIDHHEINQPYPKSNIIINPKKNNGYLEYDYLCATALTYFFLEIVIKKIKSNFEISNFLIYVLLATVCDVMPLRRINKIIANYTIKNFVIEKNIAIKTLFDLLGLKKKLTINDLGYLIGPIINSGGRLGYSSFGTELLSSNDISLVSKKANQLIKLNNKRKDIEKKILDKIDFEKIKNQRKNVIIVKDSAINEGLIGIIAARLNEYFNRPSIVITNSKNILKGSARSINNYNIGRLVKLLSDKKIIEKGGGHNMAAGFTIRKDKFKILEKFIQNDYLKKNISFDDSLKYDSEISSSSINKNFTNEIDKLGPFGNSNPSPKFLLRNLKIINTTILNKKHISAILKPPAGRSFKSICFNCMQTSVGKYLLSYKKNINVIGQIQENIWNNKKTLQLIIKDVLI